MSQAFKRVTLALLLAVSFTPQPARGKDCSSADIRLYTQAEVDNFQATFGNGGTCNRVTGDLFILTSDGDNIDGLIDLTSIGGELYIDSNSLLDVLGLANLTEVGGDLTFLGHSSLTNVDGLTSLVRVGGNLNFVSTALTSITGLAGLKEVGGGLYSYDSALTNVDGLENLTNLEYLDIDSTSLTNLDGLAGLVSIDRGLHLGSNSRLVNVDGLSQLKSAGSLHLEHNGLENLDGLSSLTNVRCWVEVSVNYSLADCGGLSRLLDNWDDGEPGPGPSGQEIPDVGGGVGFWLNMDGCNSVEEILAGVDISNINAGLNDAWYFPETDGQGFFITVYPYRKKVSLAWFTYDTELPPPDAVANLGDPGQRWLTAIGPIDGNQVVMRIIMTSGGIFDTPTEVQRTDPLWSDGSLTLTFDSCNSGTVEYDIPSINRTGVVPIMRVANDNIALCEMLIDSQY
jgi:hypothetical protein